jgi:hypothetical protein
MVVELFRWLSGFFQPHLPEFATALVATVLVLYGEDINSAIKKVFKKEPFAVRFSVFVLVCAFGYGAVTVLITRVLTDLLGRLDGAWLSPLIIAAFIALGLLAEEKRQI